MSKVGDMMIDKMNDGPLDPNRLTHVEQMEEINSRINGLMAEARCLIEAEFDQPKTLDQINLFELMDTASRVWRDLFGD